MDTSTISQLFTGRNGESSAIEYLRSELDDSTACVLFSSARDGRCAQRYGDLARLHKTVCARSVFTVMEFGVGYSTLVIADALLKNKMVWEDCTSKPPIRCSTRFQIHSVDASAKWIESTKLLLPSQLMELTRLSYSVVEAGLFEGRSCHYYSELPDVVPDLIYLDGPNPADVVGSIGVGWSNTDRVVLGADILRIEPWLLPGCMIIVDGRSANARFIASHLYRKWDVNYNEQSDVTVMELQEAPLGAINRERLRYCLGERILSWR